MLGSAVLDTAIGLIFVFFTISTLCSNIYTIIARVLNSRGKLLKKGLDKLLGPEMCNQVMSHPLIQKNTLKNRSILGLRLDYENLPDWIDPKVFSEVVAEVCEEASKMSDISRVLPSEIHHSIVYFTEQLQAGRQTLDDTRTALEKWYNDRMYTLTEIFRRQSQYFIGIIAAIVAITFNINTLVIAQALWEGPTLRDAVVEAAGAQIAANADQGFVRPSDEGDDFEDIQGATDVINDLSFLNIPIGWTEQELATFGLPSEIAMTDDPNRNAPTIFISLIGWVITIGAAMFGGTFWYELLKRLTGLRSGSSSSE